MTVTALAKKDDSVDPRAALRSAVADAQEARAAIERHHEAIERSQQFVFAARRKAESASKAVAAARDTDAEQLAAAIVTGITVSPQATVRAREAEIEASNSVLMARAAYERLAADLKDVEAAATRANKDVDAALATMLEPLARRMLDEVRTRKKAYLTAQAAVSALGTLWNSWDDLAKQIDRTSSANEDGMQASTASRKRWESALASLRLDADADLPSIED